MALNVSSLRFQSNLNQYVKLPNTVSVRGLDTFGLGLFFTVGALSLNESQLIYCERQGTSTGIRLAATATKGKLQFLFSPKDGTAATAYTYNTSWDDRWHHMFFAARLTGDDPTYEIFLDSVSVAEGTLILPSGTEAISDTAPKGVYLGNHSRLNSGESFPASTAWDGFVDEVMLFTPATAGGSLNTYISDREHWELPDEDVLAYFKFDANTGTTAVDGSAYTPTRSGTLYQGVSTSSALWHINRPFLGDGLLDTVSPSTPVSNAHTNVTEDGFSASWSASTDNVWVQFYELQVSEFANFSSYIAYDTVRNLSQVITGLLPATNYYWRVRAFDAELNASGYSSVRSLTTANLADVTPPNAPTNLSVSFLTHTSFRLSFTQSASMDAVGYKLDISTSPDFDTFLTAYRNQDIGNTSYIDINGLNHLTKYYVRLRAYDTVDNESDDSVAFEVNTPRRPDVTPPEVAVMLDPLSVTSRTATMRWLEGVDDTEVVGYYLDLSTASNFASYVVANNISYNVLDVGNVTSYLIQGLTPDTTYYARIRAYDDADNIAGNMETPIEFTTAAPSIYEGDLMQTSNLPVEGTIYDGSTFLFNPPSNKYQTSTRYTSYMHYGRHGLAGTLQRVRWKAYFETTGVINVNVAAGDLDPMPTFIGTGVNYTVTSANSWIEIDLTSFMITDQDYVVRITSTSVGAMHIDNSNNPPMLVVETDPMTATQTLPAVVTTAESTTIINHNINPSFEINSSGYVLQTSATLGRTATLPYSGAICGMVGTTASTASGVRTDYFTDTWNEEGITFVLSLRSANTTVYTARMEVVGLDDLNVTTGWAESMVVTAYPSVWKTYVLKTSMPVGAKIYTAIKSQGAIIDVRVDNWCIYNGINATQLGAFDGDTLGASWLGTAHASKSIMEVPTFRLDIPFLGDANENNTFAPYIRDMDDTNMLQEYPLVIDRTTKTATTNSARAFAFRHQNLVYNPSFEVNDLYWTGGTRVLTEFFNGTASYQTNGTVSTLPMPVTALAKHVAQGRVKPNVGVNVVMKVHARATYSGSVAATYTLGSVVGDGSWKHIMTPFTMGNYPFATISFECTGNTYVDSVGLTETSLDAVAYRDGSFEDCFFEGIVHASRTTWRGLPNTIYAVNVVVNDPDGFFDDNDSQLRVYEDYFTTPPLVDNKTTLEPLEFVTTPTTIEVTSKYVGDDNQNNTTRFEFKRSDLSTWSEIRPTYDRINKEARCTITHLNNGTQYTIRAIYSDIDGVFGSSNSMVTGTATTTFLEDSIDSDPLISFGGFILMGNNNGEVGVTSHDAFGFPSRRLVTEPLSRLDGSVERQALWGEKTIRMSGYISGDSRGGLHQVRKALIRALSIKQQRLIIDTLENTGRYYYATCESLEMEEEAEVNIRHLRWQASFLCADPFAYDTNETVIPTFLALTGSSIALTNEGDTLANPVITFASQSAKPITFVIVNDTTGERIAPKTTIVNGDIIKIDVDKRSLTKNGVEIDYAGAFPRLGIGANTIRFKTEIIQNVSDESALGTPLQQLIDALIPLSISLRWRNKFL